jgi:hypothetical protein
VIVETPDGFRIAREEMLRSTVLDGPGSPKATGFAVLDDGNRWLVVGDGLAATTTGTPVLGNPGEGFEYSVREDVEGLGESWSKLVGAQVTVYPSGTTCTIPGFNVLTVLTPHFGTSGEWRDAGLQGQALAEAVASAGGATYLVADLSGCAGHPGDVVGVIGEPATVYAKADDAALEAKALAAFARHESYAALQDDYASSYGGQGPWTEADLGEVTTDVWKSPDGKQTYVLVAARAGNGCGDFSGELALLYRAAKGKLEELAELPVGTGPIARHLLDTNRDGHPEVAGHAALWAWDGAAYASVYELDLGFRDCGC